MLSKSIAVTLPAALLLWQLWKQRRLTMTDLGRIVPFFVIALCITAADIAFYRGREIVSLDYSLVERALIAARALWFYLGKLLLPTDLAVIYPLWEVRIADPAAWAYLVAACGLAALLWFYRRRIGAGPLVGASFFAITLAPVLGFVDYGYMQFSFVADRYQYLAGIGVIAVLGGIAAHCSKRLRRAARTGLYCLAALILAVHGAMTWRQAGIYRDPVTFFGHIVSRNPQARDAHLNLAAALMAEDRAQEALDASLVAIEQGPAFSKAHTNAGLALMRLARYDEADAHLDRALELEPSHRTALQNKAVLLARQGRYEESLGGYREVLEIAPEYALAYAGMAHALFALERYQEALEAAEKAISLEPTSSTAGASYLLMGRSAQRLGSLGVAEEHFLRAIEIDPQASVPLLEISKLARLQGRLGEADEYLQRARNSESGGLATLQAEAELRREQGRYEEALESYRSVLEIDPEYALAHGGMGHTLFDLERYAEAVESMQTAVSLQPDLPMAGTLHGLTGRALQQLARIDAAVEHFRRAIEIDSRDEDAIDRLALLYYQHQRYQEASSMYRALLELRPESAQTVANLAATLYFLGRNDEAIQNFERALSLDPTFEAARDGIEQIRAATQRPAQ